MKATVRYSEDNQIKTITFEAADAGTIKNAVSQWRYNEYRVKKRNVNDIVICQSCLLGDKSKIHSMKNCPGHLD